MAQNYHDYGGTRELGNGRKRIRGRGGKRRRREEEEKKKER
jgi:hypothetical protein